MQDGGAVQDGEPGKGGTWEGSVADKASNRGRHLSAELIAQNRTGSPTTAQTNGDQIIEKEGKKEASGEPLANSLCSKPNVSGVLQGGSRSS